MSNCSSRPLVAQAEVAKSRCRLAFRCSWLSRWVPPVGVTRPVTAEAGTIDNPVMPISELTSRDAVIAALERAPSSSDSLDPTRDN
jgi:hypothetical protein